MDIEHVRANSSEIKEHLVGKESSARQHLIKSRTGRDSTVDLHRRLRETIFEIDILAKALANSAEITTDELFRAHESADTARNMADTSFNSENAAKLRQAMGACATSTETLANTSLNNMREFAEKLSPLLAACADMQNAPAPFASEDDYRETSTAITHAHQEMVSYEQNLG